MFQHHDVGGREIKGFLGPLAVQGKIWVSGGSEAVQFRLRGTGVLITIRCEHYQAYQNVFFF